MSALLALAGLVLGHTSARATLTQADGDVFLGFRSTASQKNAFLVNLGSYTQFTNAAPFATLTFGSNSTFGADLRATAQFGGASWSTTSSLFWGIFGSTSDGLYTIYATKARTNVNTPATPWTALPTYNERSNVDGGITTVRGGFVNTFLTTESTNTGNAGFQSGNNSGSYYEAVAANPDFSTASTFSGGGIEGSFNGGPKKLDFFALGQSGTTDRLGSFTIDGSTGVVTFSAVPEPSTYMLMALAGTIFMVFFRRRRAFQQ